MGNANVEQTYAKRMPSTVHYTITFTDEYGDEHVTSLLSVEYKSACTDNDCYTHPDFAAQSLEEHAESVNQSIGALPRGAIENKYVWTVGTDYDAAGVATQPNGLGGQTWQVYPQDGLTVDSLNPPESVAVDQLEYRLDAEVIHPGCQGLDITGTADVTQYGLCVFI